MKYLNRLNFIRTAWSLPREGERGLKWYLYEFTRGRIRRSLVRGGRGLKSDNTETVTESKKSLPREGERGLKFFSVRDPLVRVWSLPREGERGLKLLLNVNGR